MTKVSYMVGNEEFTDWRKARERARELSLSIKLIYTPIVEELNTEHMEKVKKHLATMRAKRA